MTAVEPLTPEVEAEWDAYVDAHPAGRAFHRAGWARVIRRSFGQRPIYRLARTGGRIRGILPLVAFASPWFGRYLVATPFLERGGILAADAEARELLAREAGRQLADTRSAFCELRQLDSDPLPATGASTSAARHKVAFSHRVDVPESELWARVGPKTRNLIRKAERRGLVARVGDPDRDLDAFYRTFAVNMHRLGTPVYPRRFFHEIFREFPGDTMLILVEDGSWVAAAAVVIAFGGRAELHWAGSRLESLPAAPNMLLYWWVLLTASRRGLREVGLGRSTEGSGPYRFKKQWRAEVDRLRWDYLLPDQGRPSTLRPETSRYRVAAAIWKRLPFSWTLCLGPPIARHLP